MTLSNHPVASPATSVPAYCGSSVAHPEIKTPAQWLTCAKAGWNQPTTTAAHIGQTVGHALPAVFAAIMVILVITLAFRARAAGSTSAG